jgi:hypothetical protein
MLIHKLRHTLESLEENRYCVGDVDKDVSLYGWCLSPADEHWRAILGRGRIKGVRDKATLSETPKQVIELPALFA